MNRHVSFRVAPMECASTDSPPASNADQPSMKDLLGVKEEDEKQNQREKTAYVVPYR